MKEERIASRFQMDVNIKIVAYRTLICVLRKCCVQVHCTVKHKRRHNHSHGNMLIFYYRVFKRKAPPPHRVAHKLMFQKFFMVCVDLLRFLSLVADAHKFLG